MAHIDVFQYYDNLVATGVSEPQAKEQARAFNAALDGLVTKEDLNRTALAAKEDLANSIGLLRAEMNIRFDHIEGTLENRIENAVNGLKAYIDSSVNGLKGYALRWVTIIILLNIGIPIIFILWQTYFRTFP